LKILVYFLNRLVFICLFEFRVSYTCVKLHSGSFRDLLERELLNVVHESYISVACVGFDFAFLLASNFVCSLLLID
jgi:hypothetical protein